MSGLAATLLAADPGTRVRLVLEDGSEVSGELGTVNGETVEVDGKSVELKTVKRLRLQFGARDRPRQAA